MNAGSSLFEERSPQENLFIIRRAAVVTLVNTFTRLHNDKPAAPASNDVKDYALLNRFLYECVNSENPSLVLPVIATASIVGQGRSDGELAANMVMQFLGDTCDTLAQRLNTTPDMVRSALIDGITVLMAPDSVKELTLLMRVKLIARELRALQSPPHGA